MNNLNARVKGQLEATPGYGLALLLTHLPQEPTETLIDRLLRDGTLYLDLAAGNVIGTLRALSVRMGHGLLRSIVDEERFLIECHLENGEPSVNWHQFTLRPEAQEAIA